MMKRRQFIASGALFAAGGMLFSRTPFYKNPLATQENTPDDIDIYTLFRNPKSIYRPFVRWWWNGNKVYREELIRELRLLKEAGIGGVEINPIEFPHRIEGDDLGIPSLQWLSPEWIEMLQVTLEEARRLEMHCDLIVGSGWPFGAETLPVEERARVVLLNAIEVEGPQTYEISRFSLFDAVDPGVTVPYPGRTFKLLSLKRVPNPMQDLEEAVDIPFSGEEELLRIPVPEGVHVLYALIEVQSFASVINGAPGAAGPILNHMDAKAVRKYLTHMSDTLEKALGPLSNHLRALFTDSMELEGCNWTSDLPDEFRKRRGYDLLPWLPFILFKVGRLGAVVKADYGAAKSPELTEKLNRVRFDFELTKAELLNERFTQTYLQWCRELGVQSRAQTYGRGFFPLETSLGYDIPEGESWTTNWLKHKVGEEMPEEDYRRGRAYTMINKYVSSAAHLQGTRTVSCEEMTNTYLVFNTSLERLKAGSDQSLISGITHSVWHGFNYSPPEAPYPGWIQYGSYYNEQNNWWPHFHRLNTYKARLSALLQQADMYTDVAILPANYDLWAEMGVQTDPFPEKLNVPYTSLIWESICKQGGQADYITEIILEKAKVQDGKLVYGPKSYSLLILPGLKSLQPQNARKLHDFVATGGNVLCVNTIPSMAPGLLHQEERDREVRQIMASLQKYPRRFQRLEKPEDQSWLNWVGELMEQGLIPRYLKIQHPSPWLMQMRYITKEGEEILFFANVHTEKEIPTRISLSPALTEGKQLQVWDAETGERYQWQTEKKNELQISVGPSSSLLLVYSNQKDAKLPPYQPPVSLDLLQNLPGPWELRFTHCRAEKVKSLVLQELIDLKELEDYAHFSGSIHYTTRFRPEKSGELYLDLGKVHEISEVWLNGKPLGLRWYGKHIYEVSSLLQTGENRLEVKVTTLMGNYMKSLTDNPNAQYWTNKDRKNQPLTSLGLQGPVRLLVKRKSAGG